MACGRSFTRKYSAQRHVNDTASGHSSICGKDQYDLGIKTGALIPRSYRPTFRKNDVNLVDRLEQELKEKLADKLADDVLRDPQSRKLLTAMFMGKFVQEQAKSNDSDVFSKWVSRNMGQFWTP